MRKVTTTARVRARRLLTPVIVTRSAEMPRLVAIAFLALVWAVVSKSATVPENVACTFTLPSAAVAEVAACMVSSVPLALVTLKVLVTNWFSVV